MCFIQGGNYVIMLYLQTKYRVVSVHKKTKAKVFTDLKPGDTLVLGYELMQKTAQYVGGFRVKHVRTGDETIISSGVVSARLAFFELEAIHFEDDKDMF